MDDLIPVGAGFTTLVQVELVPEKTCDELLLKIGSKFPRAQSTCELVVPTDKFFQKEPLYGQKIQILGAYELPRGQTFFVVDGFKFYIGSVHIVYRF
jgi:hypothetical protein